MSSRARLPRRPKVAAVLLLAGALVAGCGVLPTTAAPRTQDAPPSAAPASPEQTATRTTAGGAQVSAGQLNTDLGAAEQVVDQFWSKHWPDLFTGDYRSPKIFGLYASASDGPTCGNEPADPDNAFYCSAGDFLAFGEPLLEQGYQTGTNGFTYLVVAHEWGHAIQNRLAAGLNSQSAELQADCFAGATLYGAAADGSLRFEQGDEKAIVSSLTALADNTAWTMTSDHGDAFQRIEAFDTGRQGGVKACLPMQQ